MAIYIHLTELVYIKNKANPLIYKQPTEIKVMSNQISFRRNYLQEFIQKQSEVNSTLKNASVMNTTKDLVDVGKLHIIFPKRKNNPQGRKLLA